MNKRLGLAEGVTFPRVVGIECVGTVDAPGTEFTVVRYLFEGPVSFRSEEAAC